MQPVFERRVAFVDTFSKMKPGDKVTFDARQTASYNSASVQVHRANRSGRFGRLRITTADNGCTYTIERVE